MKVEEKKELESFLEKKKRLISDLECMSNQYAVIESMHSRQDEILRRYTIPCIYSSPSLMLLLIRMFDGNYGSAEENCLEQKLDQLELQQGIIQVETDSFIQSTYPHIYTHLVELLTKVKRRSAKISQSQKRPLIGPSPG